MNLNQERLEQIYLQLWDMRHDSSPEALQDKIKLVEEMDLLDPAGISILDSLRQSDNVFMESL